MSHNIIFRPAYPALI